MKLPEPHAVLAGKYRVLSRLGEGGMGVVFRAQNVLTGKHVALKWMHAHLSANPDAATRLLREAQAASALSHPNVVDVYDIVQDGPTLFMVMELLEGQTLREYLDHNPRPRIADFIALLLPALHGVAAAHDKGVIHRDLKPDNIFLVRHPMSDQLTAKVVDFGVAKLAASQAVTLTQTGMAIGTPLYMSLEQLRGDKGIDERADIYAFGVMLYEAIAGCMPYTGSTLSELAIRVATSEAVPLKQLRKDVPQTLTRIVDWAIAKEREQRLPNVRLLIRELEVFAREYSFRDQMTDQARAMPLLAAAEADKPRVAREAADPRPDTFGARELGSARGRKRPGASWFIAGALAIFAAIVSFAWLRRDTPSTTVSAAQSPAPALAPAPSVEPPPAQATHSAPATAKPEPTPPATAAPEPTPATAKPEPTPTAKPEPTPTSPAAPEPTPPPTGVAEAAQPPSAPPIAASPSLVRKRPAAPKPQAAPEKASPPTPEPRRRAADVLAF